jgi:Methyltransferase domain
MSLASNIKNLNSVIRKHKRGTRRIDGWLAEDDAAIMATFLLWQNIQGVNGDILEIGVYQGKSAHLLATCMAQKTPSTDRLFLVDVFSLPVESSINQRENEASYSMIRIAPLNELLNSIGLGSNLEFVDMDSQLLGSHELLNSIKIRFAHIDGSHNTINVLNDIKFACSKLINCFGIIVLDDYRAIHAPGVSRALWKALEEMQLRIFLFGPTKIYLISNENTHNAKEILTKFGIAEFRFKSIPGGDFDAPFVSPLLEKPFLSGIRKKIFKLLFH